MNRRNSHTTHHSHPTFFTAALLLSLTGSGIYLTICLALGLFYSYFSEKMIESVNLFSMNGTSPAYFLTLSMFAAVSLWGIIMLWKNRKKGYFVYLAAQTGILLLPSLTMGPNALSSLNMIFTALFAIIYLILYRRLN